eukprot:m.367300 g.367300  ORF g.367300 m.367300 type:complete len:227 (+) comp39907_c0_seq1:76-756(+)
MASWQHAIWWFPFPYALLECFLIFLVYLMYWVSYISAWLGNIAWCGTGCLLTHRDLGEAIDDANQSARSTEEGGDFAGLIFAVIGLSIYGVPFALTLSVGLAYSVLGAFAYVFFFMMKLSLRLCGLPIINDTKETGLYFELGKSLKQAIQVPFYAAYNAVCDIRSATKTYTYLSALYPFLPTPVTSNPCHNCRNRNQVVVVSTTPIPTPDRALMVVVVEEQPSQQV